MKSESASLSLSLSLSNSTSRSESTTKLGPFICQAQTLRGTTCWPSFLTRSLFLSFAPAKDDSPLKRKREYNFHYHETTFATLSLFLLVSFSSSSTHSYADPDHLYLSKLKSHLLLYFHLSLRYLKTPVISIFNIHTHHTHLYTNRSPNCPLVNGKSHHLI